MYNETKNSSGKKVVGKIIQLRSKTLVENDNPKSDKQRRSKTQIDPIWKAGI